MGNRKAERELRGERIFRNYRKGWRVREIVDDEGVSETTVRRAIDDGWIAEMQAQRGFSVCWSEEQVAGLVEGLDEETAARLLRRLRLRRVPRLLKRLESIDQVADSLSLETEDVERVFEKEQNRKQQQAEENRKRENRINQIRVLHAANKPLEQIKAQVDLPKHTVAEIFNGLQREAEDEKAKDSEATDNPDGKA
jgi:transposase